MQQFAKALCIAAAVITAAMGCNTSVVDIDRTQPNRVDKSIFKGEWYFRPVVVESQFNQGILFEGLNGNLDRVRWEITKDFLTAYRSYAMMDGAEVDRQMDGGEFKGSPVAAFKIDSHFDVFREYNPSTGEQNNVLVENTTDNPWFDRKYMRVDWSKNHLNNFVELSGAVEALSSAPYYVQPHEIDNPHRAEITENSINVVNNYVLINDFYTCYGLYGDYAWCGRSNAKMKLSFMKVTERNYEPLHYPDGIDVVDHRTGRPIQTDWYGARCDVVVDGHEPNWEQCSNVTMPMFSRFGYFRTERRVYDEEYAWTRSNRVFLANRYNMWKRSYDSTGDLIPAKFREPGKITFHTNPDFPLDDILTASRQIEADWDDAFRETVAELKGVAKTSLENIFELKVNDCNVDNATTFAQQNNHLQELRKYGISEVQTGNLKRACAVLEHVSGGKFSWQKPGDLRWSFMHWVDAPQVAGPLGYGPSGADPITGEIIASNSYIYGASIDSLAAYAADIVSLANGKLELDHVIDGETIRRQMAQSGNSNFAAFSPAQFTQAMQRFDSQESAQRLPNEMRHVPQGASDGRLKRVRNTPIERELLLNDDLRRAMHGPDKFQPGSPVPAGEDMSPLAWTEDHLIKMHRDALDTLSKDCILLAEWADDGMAHLAEELKDLDWEEVYRWMRREVYRGVMAHEIGHTIGLRHNFSGSADALNYHPQFWDSFDAVSRQVHRVDPNTGLPTSAERLMYSSIMDYDARFYADSTKGIGPYDKAAIKFGYGQLVEVFEPEVLSDPRMVDPRQNYGDDDDPFYWDEADGWVKYMFDRESFYTEWPYILNGSLNWDSFAGSGQMSNVAAPQNLWKRRNVPFADLHKQLLDFYQGEGPSQAMVAVPYKFCPDEMRWATNVECQPWDKGASHLEMVQDRIERYNKYYFFTNFKRDRRGFNDYDYLNSYISRQLNNFFLPIVSTFQAYLYRGRYMGTRIRQNWLQASYEGLNFFASVLQQPEPGSYCLGQRSPSHTSGDAQTYYAWTATADSFADNCATKLNVPLGVGKYYNTNWTDEYYYKATVIGSFWDKYMALWAMTANEGNFWREFANFLDTGSFSLSYWIGGLEEEVLQVFADAFVGESGTYAWRVLPGGGADSAEFVATPVIDIYQPMDYAAMPKLESASSWTLQYFSVLLPMARFNSYYDWTADFSWYTRTCLKGYQDCLEYDPSYGQTEFTDPISNYTYVAPNNNLADPTQPAATALGARMLTKAQAYVDNEYQPARDAYMAVIDDETVTDEDKAMLFEQLGVRERRLHELVSFVDIVRNLAHLLDFGG